MDDLNLVLEDEKKVTDDVAVIKQDALGAISTKVDIVFCIDITGSMAPTIQNVKDLTLSLYDELINTMDNEYQRRVDEMRVKVFAFRDYYCDGSEAMLESDYFILPDEKNKFYNFVSNLEAAGGGDEPENSLEALALAMKTDWVKVSDPNREKARNVIVLFTDASAHPLEKAKTSKTCYYPSDMLTSYGELYEAWQGQGRDEYSMNKDAKRLIIFAPEDSYPWNDIAEEFDNTAVVSINEADGGSDLARSTIIATISGSMK